jgi:ABC-type multidrug transport system fused ATPase/permease subunit
MQKKSVLSYYVSETRAVLPHKVELLAFVGAGALHAFGHALVALMAGGVAIALIDAPGAKDTLPLLGGRLAERALALSLAGLAAVFAKGVAGVYATYVQSRIAGDIAAALRLELLDALLTIHRLRQPRHLDQGAGVAPGARAVAALTERVRDVEGGIGQGVLGGARAVAQLVPLTALLFALSPRMALAAGLVQGTFGWLLGRMRSGYKRALKRAAHEREHLLEAADEAVRHADLWVAYGAESKARARMRSLGTSIARGSAWLDARVSGLSSANEVLGAAALVAAVAACSAGWLGGSHDGTTLLAFAIAFFLAYRPVRELADARLALARAQLAYEELQAVTGSVGQPPEVAAAALDGADEAPAPEWPSGALEVRSLRLAYGACAPVSLRLDPGAIAVLTGPTGVGKTTLLRTLLGLEPSRGGQITFEGRQLSDAPAGPRARPFAWVPQEAPLLADTLEANVALGSHETSTMSLLGPLGATHLPAALEGGRLGAGGRAVSGGERQWIAIARAIATRQPVLLLDEPTNGLDPRAERAVLDAIARLRGKRTVILVTHRREPLSIADVVVRLEPAAPEERAA